MLKKYNFRHYLGSNLHFLDRLLSERDELAQTDRIRSRIFIGFLASLLVTEIIFIPIILTIEGFHPRPLAGLASFIANILIYIGYQRFGRRDLFADLFLLQSTGLFIVSMWVEGGLQAPTATLAVSLPIIGQLLGKSVRAVHITVILGIGCLMMLNAESYDVWAPSAHLGSLEQHLLQQIFALLFVGTAIYLYQLYRNELNENRRHFEQTRRHWIALVSAELRTPLRTMSESIALAQSDALDSDPERQAKVLQLAERNSLIFHRITEKLLDIKRISSGSFALNQTDFDLLPFIQEGTNSIQLRARQRDIDFIIEEPIPSFAVHGDRDLVFQVLITLLSNGIRRSPEGEPIRIRWRQKGTFCRIGIKDHGEAIPPLLGSQLFNPYQAPSEGGKLMGPNQELSLYNSRKIIEKHGGKIGFWNQKAEGCTFFFTLPIAK